MYSVCSSAPALGVNSSRKWGSRSNQGPAAPPCSVQATGSTPATGCRGPSAGLAPVQARSATGSSMRRLTHTCSNTGPVHVVKRLTL